MHGVPPDPLCLPVTHGAGMLGLCSDVLHGAGLPLAMETLHRCVEPCRTWRGQSASLHHTVRHGAHRRHEDTKVRGPFVRPRRARGLDVSGAEPRRAPPLCTAVPYVKQVYHRRPPPAPRARSSRKPPLRGLRSSRGFASFTFKARPPTSFPFKAVIAAWAALSSAISTKPKPRGRPVSRSVMIWMRSTTP